MKTARNRRFCARSRGSESCWQETSDFRHCLCG